MVNIIFEKISKIIKSSIISFFLFLGAQWASRDAKLEAEKKIDRLHGSFVGTDIFFNFTFLQERYGKVRTLLNFYQIRQCLSFGVIINKDKTILNLKK